MKDIEIRHARIDDCPALGRIIVNATQDAFRGRVPDQCLNWLTPEESAANWAKNFKTEQSLDVGDYLFVAETTSSRVVGLAMLSKITPEDGYKLSILKEYAYELRSIQVDPEWQRQGIGQLLVSRVADELRQKKETHLLVRVLVDNPNSGFYEHLGAVRLGSRPYEWEGYPTEDVLYGWEDK